MKPQSSFICSSATATTSPAGSTTTRRLPGLEARAQRGGRLPLAEGVALADRPLEEGVLLHGPARLVLGRARRRGRRTPRAAGARATAAPAGSWSTQLFQRTR